MKSIRFSVNLFYILGPMGMMLDNMIGGNPNPGFGGMLNTFGGQGGYGGFGGHGGHGGHGGFGGYGNSYGYYQ